MEWLRCKRSVGISDADVHFYRDRHIAETSRSGARAPDERFSPVVSAQSPLDVRCWRSASSGA